MSDAVNERSATVELRDVSVSFPVRAPGRRRARLHAVDGVSLSVHAGETVAVVGESGSGKSTLGRVILGLQEPTDGAVRYRGDELSGLRGEDRRRFRRHVQVVFQDTGSSLNPRRTISDAIEIPMRYNLGLPRAEARRRAHELLDRVGLRASSFAERAPHELSGGQRQRVAIARALASEPELIVADEAVSALDVSVRAQILQVFRELQAETGVGYVFITHDLGVVGSLADRIVVLYLGQIVEEGTAAELLERPAHPYTAALVAAAPRPDPSDRTLLEPRLTGELPSPIDPPAGCRFHPRCPLATERCRTEEPQLREVGAVRVRCHHAEVQLGLAAEADDAA